MTALLILRQSLLNLWRHPLAILRIITLPAALALCCLGAILWFVQTQGLRHPAAVVVPVFAVGGFVMLWVTVNLHRLFLLGEDTGWRPPLHGRAMAGYGMMLVPIVLVLVGIMVLLTLVAKEVISHDWTFAGRLMFAILLNGLNATAALRLSSLLPAIALDRPVAGYKRGGFRGILPILMISVLMVAMNTIGLLLARTLPDPVDPTSLAMVIATTILSLFWFALVTVFNISLLSVLWGHYVDGRGLR